MATSGGSLRPPRLTTDPERKRTRFLNAPADPNILEKSAPDFSRVILQHANICHKQKQVRRIKSHQHGSKISLRNLFKTLREVYMRVRHSAE